ncbi:MAG: hypothetical protein CEE42_10620 [Promethearchaeota archaeon Loki_b31]|nr:MAG: hypothetical protein CEE42_10620 [Candidatus Lokiarchaeota archaeon Loki_b31]
MGKEKKKSLGIKTTRYFTKTCTKCKFEYPNWFTNCPKCGAAWDSVEAEKTTDAKEALKKTIKIIVKITEEDFNNTLERVKLIFSADQGRSWYQMEMENQLDFFIAEITDVPVGSNIIYYIEVILIHGEQIIENNEGNYFHYKVGVPIEDLEKDQQISKGKIVNHAKKLLNKAVNEYDEVLEDFTISKTQITNDLVQKPPKPQPEYFKPKLESNANSKKEKIDNSTGISQIFINKPSMQPSQHPKEYSVEDNITIFGKLQTKIDPDLKICPHCNSKIKKIWSTCPICGKNL